MGIVTLFVTMVLDLLAQGHSNFTERFYKKFVFPAKNHKDLPAKNDPPNASQSKEAIAKLKSDLKNMRENLD